MYNRYSVESNEKTKVVSGGCGFLGLLQIAFIVLKLCGVITWSWGLVLLPLWIWLGFIGLVLIIGLIAAIIIAVNN